MAHSAGEKEGTAEETKDPKAKEGKQGLPRLDVSHHGEAARIKKSCQAQKVPD